MTSLPAVLRLPTTARPSLAVTSVAGLAAAAGVVALAAAGPRSASEGVVPGPPPSASFAAALGGSAAGRAANRDPDGDGVAPSSPGDSAPNGTRDAVASPRPRWQWPLQPRPPVVRAFRAPLTTYGSGHRGLDLGARPGDPIRAVEAGVVTHAGVVAGRGTVTVTHGDGLRSTYEPVRPTVSRGARVATGEVIGSLAVQGHCGARGCLHLGARRGHAYLDPLLLLAAGRLALLPVHRVG